MWTCAAYDSGAPRLIKDAVLASLKASGGRMILDEENNCLLYDSGASQKCMPLATGDWSGSGGACAYGKSRHWKLPPYSRRGLPVVRRHSPFALAAPRQAPELRRRRRSRKR